MTTSAVTANSLITDLKRFLEPDQVLSDAPALTAYSIDAGIYRIKPRAVVLIRKAGDLDAVIQYARAQHIPLTARSAGTNLTGNAIGEGIILEFSGYKRILEFNEQERWVRVQPGIIYADLNRFLEPYRLMFAPDPSSGDMCRIGGMLGNNAAGPHTLKYGATKDNVLSLQVVLADGTRLTARTYEMDEPDFRQLRSRCAPVARTLELVRQHQALIESKKPHVTKNSSGYNLFSLSEGLQRGRFELEKLFIGSEGTLGLTEEATLKLVPKPRRTATALIFFASLAAVGTAVNRILSLRPSAMEVMDASAMDIVGRSRHGIPGDARAMLLVEFDEDPVDGRVTEMRRCVRGQDLCGEIQLAYQQEQQALLWKARKAIYPALYRFDVKKRPINFADDVVVPASRLSELVEYLDGYFKDLGVPVAIYGHIGDGNAHINPLLDVNDPEDASRMVRASREIHETVIRRFGGSICGEHGDGRVRKSFVKDLYGEDLYRIFQQIKGSFDPGGILNPGVKIDMKQSAHAEDSLLAHLDYERFTKLCATCGKCNTVCPAHDILPEESNGARGWFHILTDRNYSYEDSKRVVEACLNCKSCRVVCPAGIDVSDAVLARRAEHPNRLAGTIFWLQDRRRLFESCLSLLGLTQPLWDRPWGRMALEYLARPVLRFLSADAKIPQGMVLPKIAVRNLRQRHSDLTVGVDAQVRPRTVAYFHGCAANYFRDGVGDSLIRTLRKVGIRVAIPMQKCSGTPIQTYGLAERVRGCARYNINSLQGYSAVVTGCASCTLMLKDYPNLFGRREERERAAELASRVLHITEFLAEKIELPLPGTPSKMESERVVTYHSSCHLRAAGVTQQPRELLKRIPGVKFVEMQDADRCAGGAGTFIVKNYDLSKEIFDRKRRAIAATNAEVVATSCPACMLQLNNGLRGQVQVRHVIQLLDEALEGE